MRHHGARFRASGWAAGLATVLAASSSLALSESQARQQAEAELQAAAATSQRIAPTARATTATVPPAERVAAGELMLRTRDYDRAAEELGKVVELFRQGQAPESTYADAAFLQGEAYFQSQQLLSAQRSFRTILDQGQRAPFDSYAGRALSRLVDIAWRRSDTASFDYIFERLAQLPATDESGSVQYARAKAHFTRGNYAAARSALGTLSASSPYAHQAQYLLGVILTKEAAAASPAEPSANRFAQAIEQFRSVTRMPGDTQEHRHVIDLAWMAIGRLYYEVDNYLDASSAYSRIGRSSPEFSAMLFELSWVWVRLGDYERAQRSLEVLTITDPGTLEVADGALLRADLMLRSGQFDRALAAYESVRDRFDPLRAQVERFLSTTTDPAVYYDKLTAEEFAGGNELSPLVLEWARQQAEEDNVFSMIDDVTRSRATLRRANRLATKLRAMLSSRARAKAFPELRAALEQTVGAINRLGAARHLLARGMDSVASDEQGGELASVRGARRALMRRVGFLPVTEGDFVNRESVGETQWNLASQQLQRLTLEVDRLRAIVNGLHRVLQDAAAHGVVSDAASRDRFREEVAANERDLEVYQARISAYQEIIEMGRAQIGFGDQRYVEDDEVRKEFRRLFLREVELVASGQDTKAVDYARQIQGLLQRADATESELSATRAKYEAQAEESAVRLVQVVNQEASNLEGYASTLEGLDQQARLLVGQVAMNNFARVRDRLKTLVLKADVGIVQQAWEVREVQRLRVVGLQRERAREEQLLNDELREVLDDAEDEQ
jgi:tetratricopeptide (TPR) repeat protein